MLLRYYKTRTFFYRHSKHCFNLCVGQPYLESGPINVYFFFKNKPFKVSSSFSIKAKLKPPGQTKSSDNPGGQIYKELTPWINHHPPPNFLWKSPML